MLLVRQKVKGEEQPLRQAVVLSLLLLHFFTTKSKANVPDWGISVLAQKEHLIVHFGLFAFF